MSIQNTTLHFHFPLVTGSDRPVFSDYNNAMELLDEQLYSAVSDVTVFAEQIAALQETSGEHTTELGELNTFKTEQDGINTANANRFLAISQALENQAVTNSNKFNSVSIADAYDATRTYSVGDVVTYNGDRYRCITAITTGEPFDADKWQGEDVQTVISQLNSDLIGTEYNISLTGVTSRKIGQEVTIKGQNVDFGTINIDTTQTIVNALPVEIRPSLEQYIPGVLNGHLVMWYLGATSLGLKVVDTGVTYNNVNFEIKYRI